MADPIMCIDVSEVREGSVDEVKKLIAELVHFVDVEESLPFTYAIYLDEAGRRMTVIQLHPDSASLEFHQEIGSPIFKKFSDYIVLRSIDIYGVPSDKLLGQLRRKSEMLGGKGVEVHALEAGFFRVALG